MDLSKAIQSAFQFYQSGNLQQAKDICAEILKEEPDNKDILYLLGIVYAQLEEYDLAIQHTKKSLQFNINNPDAYLALGAIYQKKGLFDEAIHFYQKAVEIDPDFAEVYENLGDIFRDNKQFDEAIAYYKKAIQYFPNAAEIYCSLGNIFRDKNQIDLSTYYYRQALKHKPDYAEVYNNLGFIFYEQRRLDEAISYYDKALQYNPGLAGSCSSLGEAFHEKKQRDEAIACYRDWSWFLINVGFKKVEMMINAVINQFYFKTLNIQFHPDVVGDEKDTSGVKRQILGKIFIYLQTIGNADNFFSDLERLIVIKNYYANRHSGTIPLQKGDGHVPDTEITDEFTAFERLHREFMVKAESIESQLVNIFDLLCRFETVE